MEETSESFRMYSLNAYIIYLYSFLNSPCRPYKELMKTNLLSFLLIFATASTGLAFGSSLDSEVPGLSIPNSHILLQDAKNQPLVLRGMAPTADQIEELKSVGVEKIIIFKNETKDEVQKEIHELRNQGFANRDILHLDFPWKDLTNLQDSCRMTVQALQFLEEAVQSQKPVFFHCTVGEDRTGYLAGLFQIWQNPDISVSKVFQSELCGHGYEAGNAHKPKKVVEAIRETLTPTFLQMAGLLKEWKSQGAGLDVSLCDEVAMDLVKAKVPVCR